MFLGNPKKKMYNNSDGGINPLGLEKLGGKYAKKHAKSNFSANAIKEELLKENPVIVWGSYKFAKPAGYFYFFDSDGNKRFIYANFNVFLAVGMDDKYIYILDPLLKNQKVKISTFSNAYNKYDKKATSC